MERVDADHVVFSVEAVLAARQTLQLVARQIGPAPESRVDDVREALATSDLQAPVQSSLYGDAFRRLRSASGDGRHQRVKLIFPLFELLHQ